MAIASGKNVVKGLRSDLWGQGPTYVPAAVLSTPGE